MKRELKIRLALLLILFLACSFSLYFLFKEDRAGLLTVAFLNIGQGDAIFIEAPSGNQMLIDGGPGRGVLRELGGVMPFYDREIDVVLATHPDSDHVSGLNDVLSKYKTKLFLEPGVEGESAIYRELKDRVVNKNIKTIEARKGMNIDLGGGAVLEILFPDRDPGGMETNTASIVAKLVYGESEFLLTGDSPSNIEQYLVSLGGLQSDVLKAGHHGSKTSTSPSFVSVVTPKYAVISVGKDNRYGHPTREVLETLKNANVQILRTDLDGRVVFKSDGLNLQVNQ